MADQRHNSNDDISRQAAGASTGAPDRERSIATGREAPKSEGASRRPATGSVYERLGPFSLIRRMTEDMDRLFENALGRGLGGRAWAPEVETFRRDDKLVVRADLPGMKKEDVNVEVNEGMLAISGERCDEREDKRDDFYRSERSYGQFYRAIPLPEGVTGDQCEATFKDGVLEITLPAPKQPEAKSRKIQIR